MTVIECLQLLKDLGFAGLLIVILLYIIKYLRAVIENHLNTQAEAFNRMENAFEKMDRTLGLLNENIKGCRDEQRRTCDLMLDLLKRES